MKDKEVSFNEFIPQLTSLRFPAVVWIAIFHYGTTGFPFSTNVFLRDLISHGYLAVTFFFVLSGFTLAVRYLDRRIELKRFMLARILRIYPLYALGLVFFVVVHMYYGTIQKQVVAIVLHLFLIQAWVPSFAVKLNSPCWFLSVLFSFYLVFPVVIDQFRRLSRLKLALVLTLIWLGSFAVLILLKRVAYAGYPSASHDLIFYHPVMHLNSFLIGVGGGIVFRADVLHRPNVHRWSGIGVMGSLVGLFVAAVVDDSGFLVHDGLLAPLFVIFIVGVALDRSWLARACSTKTALALGNMAFAIYILQAPWKVTVLTGLSQLGFRPMSDYWFPYLVTLLIVSVLAVVFIENPLHRLLLRKLSPPERIRVETEQHG
jgi:peptidoglycan/LPS O-acetylase OafA/YrhL